MTRFTARLIALTAAALSLAAPAAAQKSKDTVRLAINDVFSVLDTYHFPQDEAGAFVRTMYQTLIIYDEHKRKWMPALAKSWQRVDDRTLEFTLDEKAVFSNGNAFDSEDVKHTIDYLIDPKVRLRFKSRYTWIDRVEKLGPHKVRIVAKEPTSTDMGKLAYIIRLYDAETHKALENPADYGKTAVVTGPYKLVALDRATGLAVERVENYWSDSPYFRAPVKRVQGVFMPDRQTQEAQLLTGGIDLMRNITADEAKALANVPDIAVTTNSSGMLMYLTLDKEGRSDDKVMTDERVRKAVIMAIDRDILLKEIVPGGKEAYKTKSICFPWMIACEPTTEPYPFNPSGAKRLLAEAGYPDGFDLTLKVFAPVKYMAEAIAGQLREVGIRASVDSLPLALYTRQRGDGKFTAFIGYYPTSANPDTDNMWDFFFGADRDYWNDPLIDRIAEQGATEFDVEKRTKLYRPALDRINEKAYILPISELPIVWAHTKDIKVLANSQSATESRLGDYVWSGDRAK